MRLSRPSWASAPASDSCSPPWKSKRWPSPSGSSCVERRGELGQVPAQPVVAEQRVHHVLQLLALVGAQRLHQRLHLGHARGELLDDVVERLAPGKTLP